MKDRVINVDQITSNHVDIYILHWPLFSFSTIDSMDSFQIFVELTTLK